MLFFPCISKAQLLDTIRYSLERKPKFYINVLTYNSFIGKNFTNFSGLRCGLNYNNRIRFGLGYFFLDGGAVVSPITVTENGISRTTNGDLSFHFASLSIEYTFYHQYPWQFAFIPIQTGLGSAKYDYISLNPKQRVSTPSEIVFLYQPELNGQYNIFKWLGVAASVGYRQVMSASKNIRDNFNSPTFSLGLKLHVDELYKAAFPNSAYSRKYQN